MARRLMLNSAKSKEEKVAEAVTKLLSDYSLDLEAVGFYLSTASPYLIYCRAIELLEACQYNKEVVEYNRQTKYYANKLF
jgi:hypothetical protein